MLRLSSVVLGIVIATLAFGSTHAFAGSISIENEFGRTNGGVYTTAGLDSTLAYSVIGNSAIPSGTPVCTMAVASSSPSAAGPVACNSSPFSHTSVPFAPGNRANWSGGLGLNSSLEGVWTFTVQMTIDGVPQTATQSWSVDNTPPTVNLASTPSLTNDSTPTLPFAIVDANPGASNCSITAVSGSPDYSPCGSNTSFTQPTPLADGTYRFWVNHGDATGEFGHQGTASKVFTVDATGPTITLTSPQPGQLFSSTTPTVSVNAVDPSPNSGVVGVECRYDTSSFVACSDSSITDANLANGGHTLSVRATDGAGNISTTVVAFTIDTIAPVVTIDPLTSPTNDNTPTVEFSVNEANPGTTECVFSATGQNSDVVSGYAPCSSPFIPTAAVSDGQQAIYIRATDAVGNVGYAVQTIVIDTVRPSLSIASPLPNQVFETAIPEINLNLDDPDPGTGISLAQCAYDADALASCSSDAFADRRLADGSHTLRVRVFDGAGNLSEQSVPFSVDTGLGAPAASSVALKRLSKKLRRGKLRLLVRLTVKPATGVDPAAACTGKARIRVVGKLRKKRARTFTKRVPLKRSGAFCVATASFSLPAAYRRSKLTGEGSLAGNATFAGVRVKTRL